MKVKIRPCSPLAARMCSDLWEGAGHYDIWLLLHALMYPKKTGLHQHSTHAVLMQYFNVGFCSDESKGIRSVWCDTLLLFIMLTLHTWKTADNSFYSNPNTPPPLLCVCMLGCIWVSAISIVGVLMSLSQWGQQREKQGKKQEMLQSGKARRGGRNRGGRAGSRK